MKIQVNVYGDIKVLETGIEINTCHLGHEYDIPLEEDMEISPDFLEDAEYLERYDTTTLGGVDLYIKYRGDSMRLMFCNEGLIGLFGKVPDRIYYKTLV